MSSYSDEQARRCIDEARRTISRVDAMTPHQVESESGAEDDGIIRREIDLSEPRFVSRMQGVHDRHIRQITERDEQWARQAELARARQERDKQERAEAATSADAVQRIAALEARLAGLEHDAETWRDVVRALADGTERIDERLRELRSEIGADRKAVLDLPAVLPSSRLVQ